MTDRIKKVKYFSWLKKGTNKNFTRMERHKIGLFLIYVFRNEKLIIFLRHDLW